MDSRSDTQKNQKTKLPPMKLYLMDMDEATKYESSWIQSHPASPSWPFSMLVTGKSGSGKTNILGNLFLGTKAECICKGKKGPKGTSYGSRYIACDDLIVCGYHPDEPKWAFIRYMYGIISKDPKAPYYENIRFSYSQLSMYRSRGLGQKLRYIASFGTSNFPLWPELWILAGIKKLTIWVKIRFRSLKMKSEGWHTGWNYV